MLLHGVRIMLQAKRLVGGVGGNTVAKSLYKNGVTRFFGSRAARDIEDLILEIEQFNVRGLLSYVSFPKGDEEMEEAAGRGFQNMFLEMQRFRERYATIVTPFASHSSEDQQ